MTEDYYVDDCQGRGRGVYSNRNYFPGDHIMNFSGNKIHISEISDFTHYLQIAPELFLGPTGEADDFVNHSCEPNCAIYLEDDQVVLRAITGIKEGEELSFDYGTIMFSEPTTFQCECGKKSCRRLIGNYHSLPEDLRHKYQSANMIPMLSRYSLDEILLVSQQEAI